MSTETRHTQVETMTVGGFKLDKTFTIANVIQILLLIGGGAGIWLNGYLDRRDTRMMVTNLQAQVFKMEETRLILIEKNDTRLKVMQDSLNAHENRLNIGDERENSIRQRISELFDEFRDLNEYIRTNEWRMPPRASSRSGMENIEDKK